ncbi:MAG TPA: energy-coupling factor transporter transmembrane protein EcfT [Firmicutes bacterium]|jgi:energy-coupling factor transport system permease protein|nr:energy-coupling factor transporter transmembrane protein EcfT [Bacillota bacterium]
MSVIISYFQRDSMVHRLNPLTKMIWSVVLMMLSFMVTNVYILAVLFLSIVLVAYLAKILKEMLPAFIGLLYFAAFFLLFQVFFIPDGKTLFVLIPGTHLLRVTDQGLLFSAAMGIRLMVIAASFPVLLGTTQVKDLVVMLVEKLKIPYAYAFMFITSIRFIPTFVQEMDLIIQAQCSRAHRLDKGNFIKKFLSICPLAIPLMITSVKKAEQMAISMETRGFGSGKRTYLHHDKFALKDWMICCSLFVLMVIGIFFNIKGFLG